MADEVVPQACQNVYILPGESFAAACRRRGVKVQGAYARRRKGLPDAQVFAPERLKNNAKSRPVRVGSRDYACITDAYRALQPAATLGMIYVRLRQGMSPDAAFAQPTRQPNPLRVLGVDYPSLAAAYKRLAPPASKSTIGMWIAQGMAPDEAFVRRPTGTSGQGIIYLVTCTATGKQYVGLTTLTLALRWTHHLAQAHRGSLKHRDSLLTAIRVHGAAAFVMEVLDQAETIEDLQVKERAWIAKLGTIAPLGYNLVPGGAIGGIRGRLTSIAGLTFPSQKAAALYVAQTQGVPFKTAMYRVRQGRMEAHPRPKTPTTIDGITFPGKSEAARYVAETQGISFGAAWNRIQAGSSAPKRPAKIPTTLDGMTFASKMDAARHIAQQQGISVYTARDRLKNKTMEARPKGIATTIDGRVFASRIAAARFVAQTRGIDVGAAEYRLIHGRVDIKGKSKVPTMVEGIRFPSRRAAARHLAKTLGISVAAASGRLANGRIDIQTPSRHPAQLSLFGDEPTS
jgi:hypothetical protein